MSLGNGYQDSGREHRDKSIAWCGRPIFTIHSLLFGTCDACFAAQISSSLLLLCRLHLPVTFIFITASFPFGHWAEAGAGNAA